MELVVLVMVVYGSGGGLRQWPLLEVEVVVGFVIIVVLSGGSFGGFCWWWWL